VPFESPKTIKEIPMKLRDVSLVAAFALLVLAFFILVMPRTVLSPSVRSASHHPENALFKHTGLPESSNRRSNELLTAYGNLPIRFEVNQGQTHGEVKFPSRGMDHELFLTATEAVVVVGAPPATRSLMPGDKSSHRQGSASVLRLRLLGSDPAAQVEREVKVNVGTSTRKRKMSASV
jgi:hypothetical protein